HTSFSRDWSSDVCSSDLPSGELVRVLRAAIRQAHDLQQLADSTRTLIARKTRQAEGDVFLNREMREQRQILKHHTDVAPLRRQGPAGLRKHRALRPNRSGIDRFEPCDTSKGRRLAAS